MYLKSNGKIFHVVEKAKSNNALCGYIIPEKVSYQVIMHFSDGYNLDKHCAKCVELAINIIKRHEFEERYAERKKYLKILVEMDNEELLEEYAFFDYESGRPYSVIDSYLRHKLRQCGFLK